MSNLKYEIEYLGGHPRFGKTSKAWLQVDNQLKIVEITGRGALSAFNKMHIHKDSIVDVSFEKKGNRSVGKAAAGALIGGVLTGGVGLLVGGALGARRKNKSELFVRIRYEEREFDVVLKTGKDTDKIYAEIVSLFS